jgi:(2Fe-2S) ferredoxin
MSDQIETLQKPFDLHLLVCTNTRVAAAALPDGTPAPPPKQSCGPLGGDNVRAELKAWLHSEIRSRPQLNGKVTVRVNGSGCLDFCKKGIVVAVYPQSEFMLFVKNTPESIQDVKNQVLSKLKELETR